MSILETILSGPDGPTPLRAYVFFVCLSAVLTLLSGQTQLIWRLNRISADPVSTSGTVDKLDCPNHGHVDYSFPIAGVTYQARQFFVDGVNCRDLKIGQRVAVIYETGAPENNYALRPGGDQGNQARTAFLTGLTFVSAFVFLAPVFLAALLMLAIRLKLKR